MTKRMMIMLLITGAVFGSVFGLKAFSTNMLNEIVDAMPTPPETISSAAVERHEWEQYVDAVGTLVAVHGADLTAETDGTITEIAFESGQEVEKGQLLLTFDSAVEQGELARLEAQAELVEIERRRREKLYKRGTISKSEYDAALAETNGAKAAVAAQRGRLAKKVLRAPFSGTLGIRRVAAGQYVRAGTAIVTLQALDPIELDFSLPERLLNKVATGREISARIDAFPGERFTGKILAIEPKINPDTRNFDVRARLANPELKLKPGLFAKIRVQYGAARELLVVPRTAIKYSSYGDSVFVLQEREQVASADGDATSQEPTLEVVQRFVKLGEVRGDFVEVKQGLEADDVVAGSGLLKLRSHVPVVIENALAPTAELSPMPPKG
ncbi:efflux RND transporter periplasmic adaptor subunit [Spongiibacter thalassae]|nr:efflux RND transporter periplasmic adaptor subunit [Spongiibacter thalassae]